MGKASQQIEWRNRIVGHGEQPANQFSANDLNFRVHPPAQREALRGSLGEIGWITGVIVNRTTGNVVDGHARIEEALAVSANTIVPFIEVELSESEERLALAVFDPISAMAVADKEALDSLLREVSTGDEALQKLLSDVAEKEGIVPPDFEPVGIEEQGRLDQKAKVECPECGCRFEPK